MAAYVQAKHSNTAPNDPSEPTICPTPVKIFQQSSYAGSSSIVTTSPTLSEEPGRGKPFQWVRPGVVPGNPETEEYGKKMLRQCTEATPC